MACTCVFIIFNITSCFKICKLYHCGLKTDVVMAARGAAVKSVGWGFSCSPNSLAAPGVFRDHIRLALLNGLNATDGLFLMT